MLLTWSASYRIFLSSSIIESLLPLQRGRPEATLRAFVKTFTNQLQGVEGDSAARRSVCKRHSICTASRAYNIGSRVSCSIRSTSQVRRNIRLCHCGTSSLVVFERPLLDSCINLAEVVDARIRLGGGTSANEVRNRDRSEEADDGHHYHDFNEGETGFAGCIDLHSFYFCCLLCGVNTAAGGLYNCGWCPLIACCNRSESV